MTIKIDSQAQWRQVLSTNSVVITDCNSILPSLWRTALTDVQFMPTGADPAR